MGYLVKFSRGGDDRYYAVDNADAGDAQLMVHDHCDAGPGEATQAVKELSRSDLELYECPSMGLIEVRVG